MNWMVLRAFICSFTLVDMTMRETIYVSFVSFLLTIYNTSHAAI